MEFYKILAISLQNYSVKFQIVMISPGYRFALFFRYHNSKKFDPTKDHNSHIRKIVPIFPSRSENLQESHSNM